MLGQRRRRWTNIEPTLGQRLMLAVLTDDEQNDLRLAWGPKNIQRRTNTEPIVHQEYIPTAFLDRIIRCYHGYVA